MTVLSILVLFYSLFRTNLKMFYSILFYSLFRTNLKMFDTTVRELAVLILSYFSLTYTIQYM